MRIKTKHRNKYVNTIDGIWIRDFCQVNAPRIDLNNLSKGDEEIFLANEMANMQRPQLQVGEINWPNVVIVSDGYSFEKSYSLLADLAYKDVKIITVNNALKKWKLFGSNPIKRAVSMHVVNNPYKDAVHSLPRHDYWPNCMASIRTCPEFVQKYGGQVFFYRPVPNNKYSAPLSTIEPMLDDYRNPICAAINFSWLCRVKKLLLFCCDDSFSDERPAAVKLENELYSYEPQLMSQRIIDANLGWLKQCNVVIGNCSSGLKYENAAYIRENNIIDFFSKDYDG